jgi:hypothetical protein
VDPLGIRSRLNRFDGWEESGRSPGLQSAAARHRLARAPPKNRNLDVRRRSMSSIMSYMYVFWIVWAVILTFLLILLGYRSNLTRYEEDQIFLDDAGSHLKKEQEEILVKVNKVQPLIRVVGTVTGVLTVGIIGLYVWDALQHLM